MDKARLLAVGAVLLAAALLFAFSPQLLDRTGFFSLAEKEEQVEEPREEAGVSAGLSLTVLKPTTLEASILSRETLPECPAETEAEILVKNAGNSTAEKMFLEFGSGIKVLACSNCFLDELTPGQEIKAIARLCLESTEQKKIVAGSANSNKVEILLQG